MVEIYLSNDLLQVAILYVTTNFLNLGLVLPFSYNFSSHLLGELQRLKEKSQRIKDISYLEISITSVPITKDIPNWKEIKAARNIRIYERVADYIVYLGAWYWLCSVGIFIFILGFLSNDLSSAMIDISGSSGKIGLKFIRIIFYLCIIGNIGIILKSKPKIYKVIFRLSRPCLIIRAIEMLLFAVIPSLLSIAVSIIFFSFNPSAILLTTIMSIVSLFFLAFFIISALIYMPVQSLNILREYTITSEQFSSYKMKDKSLDEYFCEKKEEYGN